MKWLLLFLLSFSGGPQAYAEDLPDAEIEVERAIVDTEAAENFARQAKKDAKLERERNAKLLREAKSTLERSKRREADAQKIQKQAEAEIAALTQESKKYLKDINLAKQQQVAAENSIKRSQERVGKFKQRRDEILEQKAAVEKNTENVFAQTKDAQLQEKEALDAVQSANQELAQAKANQRQALLNLQKEKQELQRKKGQAKAQLYKIRAETKKAQAGQNSR